MLNQCEESRDSEDVDVASSGEHQRGSGTVPCLLLLLMVVQFCSAVQIYVSLLHFFFFHSQ